jgi:purine catabolism regulator
MRYGHLVQSTPVAMTVRRLVMDRKLGLSLAAGRAGLDRVISWAHAIDLADPSPWLSGGELVMTTGSQLPDTDAGQREYVQRIVQSGSAALAFDTGVRFSKVPPAVCAAGDELGIPVLAVAPKTPFIAISRAVIDELTADQVRLVQAVVQGQENLARVTMRGGIPALVTALSRALDATVCMLDRSGLVLAEFGADNADVLTRVRAELHHPRRRSASRAVVDDRGTLTIQQIPGGVGEGQGHLAVACAEALDATERMLVGHAVALLSIELAKPVKVVDAEQRLRKGVTTALLYNSVHADASLLRYFGFAPDSMITVAVLTDVGPLLHAEAQLIAALEDESAPYLMTNLRDGDGIAFAVDAAVAPELADRVYATVRTRLGRSINGGIGEPVVITSANLGLQQALSAARVGLVGGHKLVSFDELGTFSLLLTTQSDDVLRAISARCLGAVEAHDEQHGTRLVESLESFLHHNGHWESAAAELGVHRHTLRSRMDRVADLIGRDLDSAHTRSELWIALKARELLSLGAGAQPRV